MARTWYVYTGTTGGTNDVNNYIISLVIPTCLNGRRLCAILAVYNGTVRPAEISLNLQIYIGTGMGSGTAQPSVPPGAKKYVYFLPS